MIDLLFFIVVVVGSALRLTRGIGPVHLAKGSAAVSAFSLAICILSLYAIRPDYAYVLWPSDAGWAGLSGSGSVREVGGARVASLGSFLSRASSGDELPIQARGAFRRLRYGPERTWFWEALDSYALEEMAGGLVFFPRRPIAYQTSPSSRVQASNDLQDNGLRIIAVQGRATSTIADLETALRELPLRGVANLTIMAPSPDGDTKLTYYVPAALERPATPVSGGRLAQYQLGLSGVPLLLRYPEPFVQQQTLRQFDGEELTGPGQFAAGLARFPEKSLPLFHNATDVLARPRLGLLPRLYANPFLSWLAAVPGTYVRQLLSFRNIGTIVKFWNHLPKQYYHLDDGLSVPAFFFRLGSLGASFTLAAGAWALAQRRSRLAAWLGGRRSPFLLACVMLLQLLDLFRFRLF